MCRQQLQQGSLIVSATRAGEHARDLSDQAQGNRPPQLSECVLGIHIGFPGGNAERHRKHGETCHRSPHDPAPFDIRSCPPRRRGQTFDQRFAGDPRLERLLGLVQPNLVLEPQPLLRALGKRRVLQRAAEVDRDHPTAGFMSAELLDLLPHPARFLQRGMVCDDDKHFGVTQCGAQSGVERFARRRFVLAEEDSEVPLAQPAREIGCVAVCPARRRAEREGEKDVVTEQPGGVAAPARGGSVGCALGDWHTLRRG